MPFSAYVVIAAAFVLSLALTAWVRRIALARGMLDYPNARSSHSQPTPRGGGLAIVIASTASLAVLASLGIVDLPLTLALIGGGGVIAVVGFMDDRGSLPVRIRIVAHFAAAIWAMFILGGTPVIRIGAVALDMGIAGDALGLLAIVWLLNLFNFMDGIDGIASSEAVFVTSAGAALCLIGGGSFVVPTAALAVAAASFGFLVLNWPPAKIFMGDVGSGYLGYVIAVLAIAAARENPVAGLVWLILGAVFFVDATVTVLRRFVRGERVYEAHRTHAYQIMARRLSHRLVTLGVQFINVALLFPMAWLATRYSSWAWLIALLVIVGVSVVVLFIAVVHAAPLSEE